MKRRDAPYVPKQSTHVRIVGMPRDDGKPIHEARSRIWAFVRGLTVGLLVAVVIAWTVALVTGCNPDDYAERDIDLCVKREVFAECMASLPAGPERTHYNDWSEVVEVCDERSHWMALRLARDIPERCR